MGNANFVVERNSTAVFKLRCDVTASADPTGTLPAFAFAAAGSDPSTFTDGEWVGSYVDATTAVETASPLISGTGNGGTVELADGTFVVWVKLTVGSEVDVLRAGKLVVT